jgi:hypothetical protein
VDKSGAAWPALHGADSFGALMADLHAAMRQHHGHAAPAFINRLAETWADDPADIGALLDDRRAHFAGCLPADADAQARDVARRFALVAAAGEMATAWGILPWLEGEATRATEAVMRAWLTTRGGAGAAEDAEALERVRRFIAAHGEARFPAALLDGATQDDGGRTTINRAGFRKAVGGADCFLFFPEIWAGEVFAGADASNGARALLRSGYLAPGEAGKLQRNERVPGWKRAVRFYVVRGAIMEAETGNGA